VAHALRNGLQLRGQESLVGRGPGEDEVANVENDRNDPEHLELLVCREADNVERVLEELPLGKVVNPVNLEQ
jgi:hypothetical protein